MKTRNGLEMSEQQHELKTKNGVCLVGKWEITRM